MVVIDTYLPYDTGGPEALVQVGEALLYCCGTTLIEGSIRIFVLSVSTHNAELLSLSPFLLAVRR
jgi:hypothetical protein